MSVLSVIITGGASGIGAATARRVVRDGGQVGLIDLNVDGESGLAVANRGDPPSSASTVSVLLGDNQRSRWCSRP